MSKNEFLTMQNRLQSLEAEQAEHEMAVEEAKQRRLTEEQMKRKVCRTVVSQSRAEL